MDFGHKIKYMARDIDSMKTAIKALEDEYNECKKFTAKFLKECASSGISKVAIQKSHKSVPASSSFVFGVSNSVFSNEKRDKNGWPAIWGVVERMGIGAGCGNSSQHQIDASRLVDGVYHLKDGMWHKIDKED